MVTSAVLLQLIRTHLLTRSPKPDALQVGHERHLSDLRFFQVKTTLGFFFSSFLSLKYTLNQLSQVGDNGTQRDVFAVFLSSLSSHEPQKEVGRVFEVKCIELTFWRTFAPLQGPAELTKVFNNCERQKSEKN